MVNRHETRRDVLLTKKAEQQLNAAADWYALQSPELGDRWFSAIISAINSLERDAERLSVAHDSQALPFELRELMFGLAQRLSHRILFAIRDDHVVVHQIRHVAQQDYGIADE